MKPEIPRLQPLVDAIEQRIAACDKAFGSGESGRAAYRRAVSALCDELCDGEGARISDERDGTRVIIAGIRAHSTTGAIGALRNWQAAARRRLEQEGGHQ